MKAARTYGVVGAMVLLAAGGGSGTGPDVAEPPEGARWHLEYQADRRDTSLFDVVAVSADEGWALGYAEAVNPTSFDGRHFLLHRVDGEWEREPLPALDGGADLEGEPFLEASGPDDVWLFGTTDREGHDESREPYAARWDGRRWREVPVPFHVSEAAVSAPDDVWAVGGRAPEGESGTWRWDGDRWRRVPLPASTGVQALDAGAPGDVWAVGSQDVGPHHEMQPAALHGDGRRWRRTRTPRYRFPSPRPPEESAYLTEVVALSEDRALAFGIHDFNHGEMLGEEPDVEPIVLCGDGSSWRKAPAAVAEAAPYIGIDDLAAPDGSGGVVLDPGLRWTDAASCGGSLQRIGRSGLRDLGMEEAVRVPGTHTVWGVGYARKGPDDEDSRSAVLVSYDTAP